MPTPVAETANQHDLPAMRMRLAIAACIAVAMIPAGDPVMARPRHPLSTEHRAGAMRPATTSQPPRPGYYPGAIEGGVQGNLSFNNQLRKLSDPLDANGAR